MRRLVAAPSGLGRVGRKSMLWNASPFDRHFYPNLAMSLPLFNLLSFKSISSSERPSLLPPWHSLAFFPTLHKNYAKFRKTPHNFTQNTQFMTKWKCDTNPEIGPAIAMSVGMARTNWMQTAERPVLFVRRCTLSPKPRQTRCAFQQRWCLRWIPMPPCPS